MGYSNGGWIVVEAMGERERTRSPKKSVRVGQRDRIWTIYLLTKFIIHFSHIVKNVKCTSLNALIWKYLEMKKGWLNHAFVCVDFIWWMMKWWALNFIVSQNGSNKKLKSEVQKTDRRNARCILKSSRIVHIIGFFHHKSIFIFCLRQGIAISVAAFTLFISGPIFIVISLAVIVLVWWWYVHCTTHWKRERKRKTLNTNENEMK